MILAGRARQAGDRAGCRVRARRGQASVRSRSESVRPRGQLPDGQKKSGFGSGGGLAWARLGWVRGWHVPGQGAAERGLCGARGRPGTGQGPRGPDPRRGAPTTPIPMSLLKKRMLLSENLVMNVCFFQTFVFRLVAKVRQANSEPSLVRDLCWDLKKVAGSSLSQCSQMGDNAQVLASASSLHMGRRLTSQTRSRLH